ncbi:ATP-grasp domain-containing protein [Butyrivibrio sp. AE3003]|uniref:ATP-grasp domain-containing protein n=1 Tax=Butyrivibrio sp. AE3003 TaxID=1496721 RepID=UPI000478CE7E|nr:ATP-grasp domain-containing protein [Butyrivibrio sp. AE3003]
MTKYVILCDHENYNYAIENRIPVSKYYKILITENSLLQDRCKDIYNEIYYFDKLCCKEGYEYIDEIFKNISRDSTIGGIFALSERLVEKASELREVYNVPYGIRGEAGHIFRDKVAMKDWLKNNSNVKLPRYSVVSSFDDIREFLSGCDSRCVLKPVDSMGSDGVVFVDTANCKDYEHYIERDSRRYEIEQFIDGPMYHVDSIVYNGTVKMFSVGEYAHSTTECTDLKPLMGFIHSELDRDVLRKIADTNNEVIAAMPIKEGITHMEVIYNKNDNNVYFIEIAARVIGCGVDFAIANSCQKMFIEEAVAATFGIEPDNIEETHRKPIGYAIFYKKSGKIVDISKEEELRKIPEVRDVYILNKIGDDIRARHTSGDAIALITWEAEVDDNNLLATVGERVQAEWRLEVE